MVKTLFEVTENTDNYGGVFSDKTLNIIEIYTSRRRRFTLYEYYYSTVILFLNDNNQGYLYVQEPVNDDNGDIINLKIIMIDNYIDCLEAIKECGFEDDLMYLTHYRWDTDDEYREKYEEYIKSLFI